MPAPVLVLSNDDDLRSIVLKALGREKPVMAGDLSKARTLLRDESPQLVVVDHMAPGSGAEVVQAVREAWGAAKVILIAREAQPADALVALRQSVFAYFVRPLLADEFRKAIGNALIQPDWEDGIEVISAKPEWVTHRLLRGPHLVALLAMTARWSYPAPSALSTVTIPST